VAQAIPLPTWPHGADVCVSLTFDVDAESAQLRHGPDVLDKMTTLSAARYGPVRGVPRILELLASRAVPATFYVPGDTARRHPETVVSIAGAGHEICHHGFLHLHDDQADLAGQRDELERGFAALSEVTGATPRGYRSPGWELTIGVFDLLVQFGFAWDSSCMGDDRPYLEEHGGHSVIELPVHWSLDDVPYYAWSRAAGGQMCDPSTLPSTWLAEFDSAVAERRHVTYTMHPEFIGRGYRLADLTRLVDEMRSRASVWFATHGQVVELVRAEATSVADASA
jgi:peptidoglycan/xylan/chitin deacetylase (PgdA/CDA1 family)